MQSQNKQSHNKWFEFVGHRLEQDATWAAKSLKEVAQACSSFTERASKDYQTEISDLAKLSCDLSSDTVDALRDLNISPESGAVMGE